MGETMLFDTKAIDVHFIPGVFKISDLIARIRQEVEALGGVALIIVDTSAAYFEGDDENSNAQQSVHARRLRSLVTLPCGPCVITNCHPAKNATDDTLIPRGGGAFIAEIDGNLTASRDDMVMTLHWQDKFRGPDFAPMSFTLQTDTYDKIRDSKGRLIPTVVARHLTDTGQEELTAIARTNENLVLQALEDNLRYTAVAEIAKTLGWYTSKNEPYKSKVHRVLERLRKAKLVQFDRGRYSITEKGKKSLEN
jgi:hypothetical protein